MSTAIVDPRLPIYRGSTPPGPNDLAAFVRDQYEFFYTCRANARERPPWRHSPQWDGGIHKGRRCNAIWPKLVEFLQQNQLPIVEYMFRAIVEHSVHHVPLPNQLMSRSMLAAYREYESQYRWRCERCRIERVSRMNATRGDVFDWQEQFAPEPVPLETQWRIVVERLKGDAIELFALLLSVGRMDLLPYDVEYPQLIYCTKPAVYDVVYGELLPHEFKDLARARYLCRYFDRMNDSQG